MSWTYEFLALLDISQSPESNELLVLEPEWTREVRTAGGLIDDRTRERNVRFQHQVFLLDDVEQG